jgi:two-component system sensor histidine kinase KdpD
LATIKASASTLRSTQADVAPQDRAELLELIENQADRLDRLVTNLLDLSRVQAGALELRSQPIAVSDLVTDALRGLTPVLRATDVVLAIDDELPLVDVDHLLIGQVLANLLDNAVRHAPPDEAITVSAVLRDDGLVQVAVEDKGPGVPRAERTNVFLMFNRSGTPGGTGVGLSIAKAFVEAHDQEIWVEDVPSGGARFCFTLPTSLVTAEVP